MTELAGTDVAADCATAAEVILRRIEIAPSSLMSALEIHGVVPVQKSSILVSGVPPPTTVKIFPIDV
jgi:hypothetical protein